MSKKGKSSENGVAFGFTFITDNDGSERPQCFLRGKVLANESLKPAKLKEHLTSIHPKNALDGVESFRCKKARFEKGGTLPKFGFIKTHKPCLEASYKVAYRIAKEKKPHTIGETLVKPCALEMTELFFGTEHRKKLEAVPLSNDTINSRITDISNNILEQVMEKLKASPFPFSIQLDESTDVSQCVQLLAYVRYMHADAMKQEFLFCKPLSEATKAADILQMVNNFFAKQDFNWKRNIGSLYLQCLANRSICHFGKERSSSHYCDSLLLASTCIGIKNSIMNFTRDIVYFCEGCQLHQSSSFEPSYIQKALSRNGCAT